MRLVRGPWRSDERVGVGAVGDPLLGAGQPCRRPRARAHRAGVASPLPDSVSAKAASSWPWASGGTRRSICSARAVGQDRQRARAGVHRDGHPHARVGARQLLQDQDVGQEVGARAAVLDRHAGAHQPQLAERAEDLAREAVLAVPRRGVRRDLLVGEAPGQVADLALLVGTARGRLIGLAHSHPAPRRRCPRRRAASRAASAAEHLQPPAEAVEAQHVPALLARDPRQRPVGVDRHRMADRAQHRQVGLRVGVGIGLAQVDALARRPARASPIGLPSR